MSEQIAARLRAKDFRFPVTVLEYDDAGHLFGQSISPDDPNFETISSRFGGTVAGDRHELADSWPRVLAMLDQALKH